MNFTSYFQPPPLATLDGPSSAELKNVKRLIWVYFWLLIFEGALRKWIFPGWSNQLLIIRDPVVILIYIAAGMAGVFPRSPFVTFTVCLAVVTFFASEIFGEGNLLVTLFGMRTHFLHLPLIFVVPNVFSRRDLETLGRWFLLTAFPMVLLVLLQFKAPPEAWINNGVGGAEGGQLSVAIGKIRPPGTFSFTSVMSCYLTVLTAFALYPQMMGKSAPNAKIASLALPAAALMIGVSGSRGAVGSALLVLTAVIVIGIAKPTYLKGWMKTGAILVGAYLLLGSWSEFQEGISIHQTRFSTGGGLHDGILARTFGELTKPLSLAFNVPFFGYGLGLGTNAASGLIQGRAIFSLGEGDWERVLGESGAVLGFTFIGLRIAILVHLAQQSLSALRRENPLPLLLLASTFLLLLNGQFGVPSLLGFAVFNGALCLTATRVDAMEHRIPDGIGEVAPVPFEIALVTPARRGRSSYADELHGEVEDPAVTRFGP